MRDALSVQMLLYMSAFSSIFVLSIYMQVSRGHSTRVAGQVLAMPVHTNTSGDFAALSGTDGYVELALEKSTFPTGTTVPLHRWRVQG